MSQFPLEINHMHVIFTAQLPLDSRCSPGCSWYTDKEDNHTLNLQRCGRTNTGVMIVEVGLQQWRLLMPLHPHLCWKVWTRKRACIPRKSPWLQDFLKKNHIMFLLFLKKKKKKEIAPGRVSWLNHRALIAFLALGETEGFKMSHLV